LAGFLFALKDGFVTPELLAWEQSGLVLLMVILGGMASLGGAVIGTVTLVLMQELFQSQALFGDYARHWHLPLGVAIIALVALLPNGIAGLPAQWRQRRVARGAGLPTAPVAPTAPPAKAETRAAARLPIQGEPHV